MYCYTKNNHISVLLSDNIQHTNKSYMYQVTVDINPKYKKKNEQ